MSGPHPDAAPRTIAEWLREARRAGLSRLDTLVLLEHAIGRPREWLLAHDDERLNDAVVEQVRDLIGRRSKGEPAAYLVGVREFRGLSFEVTPDVLVPRPETELLVEWALACLPAAPGAPTGAHAADPRVLDLGTGSGAIAVSLALAREDSLVTATDLSVGALRVAAMNAARHRVRIRFVLGTWFEPIESEQFDLIVSNPPYIAEEDPHLAALAHEPSLALVSGAEGLDAIRAIVSDAPRHLRPGAWLLIEHGHDQAARVATLMREAGLTSVETRHDLAGIARVTGGRRSGPPK